MVAQLQKHGLIKREDGQLMVMLPIFESRVFDDIFSVVCNELKELAEEYADQVSTGVEDILLPYVRKDLMSNFVHWDMRIFLQQMGSLFDYGWNTDLAQPEEYENSAAGLYIIR